MGRRRDLGAERRERLAAARLYLVCDAAPGGRELTGVLRAAIAGGVDIVQLRDKDLDGDELVAVAHAAATLCRRLGALFVVNDRPDVARIAEADGAHLGQDDMPIVQAREILGTEMLVGLSTHAPEEVDRAGAGDTAARIDYIGVGPVNATPTKPGRAPAGLGLVRYAAARATLPFFAIGGIDTENAPAAIAAGARRLAVVRAIAAARDPERAARELRELLDRAR